MGQQELLYASRERSLTLSWPRTSAPEPASQLHQPWSLLIGHKGSTPLGHALSFPQSNNLSFPDSSQLNPAFARPHLDYSLLNVICAQTLSLPNLPLPLKDRIQAHTIEFSLVLLFSEDSFNAASITAKIGMHTFLPAKKIPPRTPPKFGLQVFELVLLKKCYITISEKTLRLFKGSLDIK